MNIFRGEYFNDPKSWSIIPHFGFLLQKVEEWLGPRDNSFTFLGIETNNENRPRLRRTSQYPKGVVIVLTRQAEFDLDEALFQLAHEVVHLISPFEEENRIVSFLEEGLASIFSVSFMSQNRGIDKRDSFNLEGNELYRSAIELTSPLVQADPNFIKEIRNRTGKKISDFSEGDLATKFPNMDEDHIKLLCSEFKVDEC